MTGVQLGGLGGRRQDAPFEVVERKGHGHPDTLADALAETLSRTYATYTRDRCGAVLHHQFDKVGILGGAAAVGFGGGKLTRPVRVLLNGRATARFAGAELPIDDLLRQVVRDFFTSRYPMLDPDTDLRIIDEVSQSSSPGAMKGGQGTRGRWFDPRGLEDLPNAVDPRCNDTSSGCGYAPLTPLESLVLRSEACLGAGFGPQRPAWLGTDIKIMAVRRDHRVFVTLAVPQIAAHVPDLDSYRENLAWVRQRLDELYASEFAQYEVSYQMNTRDKYALPELYLTHTGSSMEAGDEGLVGRGNRFGGLISSSRPYTMEGISGKNPVYHTGKMYCVAATEIATSIAADTGVGAEVTMIGQSGQRLGEPWQVLVALESAEPAEYTDAVHKAIEHNLTRFDEFTDKILRGEYVLS